MKFFLRPYQIFGAALLVGGLTAGSLAHAQLTQAHRLFRELNPLISHSSSGYLGVLVSDVDSESAARLRLKDVRGALITLIDHDAPAGQAGLRINDVVVSLNGQNVESAEQFSRMLREIPAGRKVTLVISRDGAQQSVQAQLVDHKAMAHDVWNKINSADNFPPPPSGMGYMASGDPLPSMHMALFTSSLHVGAVVEPLTSQMADYLGVPNGVMVKQVARKSEAAAAGMKAFDVILKVGNEPINSTADWDRALRTNEGRSVQVTIVRERKQQTVNLQVDSKHHSEVIYQDLFPNGECPEVAELNEQFSEEFAKTFAAQADELRRQMKSFGPSREQIEEMRKQAEELRKEFPAGSFPAFKFDPKATDELRKQAEELGQSFRDFKIDPQQMQELNRQMEEFRKEFPQDFQMQQQMDELKRQIEELQMLRFGQRV